MLWIIKWKLSPALYCEQLWANTNNYKPVFSDASRVEFTYSEALALIFLESISTHFDLLSLTSGSLCGRCPWFWSWNPLRKQYKIICKSLSEQKRLLSKAKWNKGNAQILRKLVCTRGGNHQRYHSIIIVILIFKSQYDIITILWYVEYCNINIALYYDFFLNIFNRKSCQHNKFFVNIFFFLSLPVSEMILRSQYLTMLIFPPTFWCLCLTSSLWEKCFACTMHFACTCAIH